MRRCFCQAGRPRLLILPGPPQPVGIEIVVVQLYGVLEQVITIVLHFATGVVEGDEEYRQVGFLVEGEQPPAAAWQEGFVTGREDQFGPFHRDGEFGPLDQAEIAWRAQTMVPLLGSVEQ